MSLVTFPRQIIIDQNGKPRVGAKLYLYDAGTSIPRVSYTTPGFDFPHTHPVLSPGNGYFPAVYVNADGGDYKLVITDSSDVQVYSEDNVPVRDRDFDSNSIGRALYQITAAEQAASVTPSNYAYPESNVLRYGAVPNRITDCLAAFNVAKAVAVYTRRIYVPGVPIAGYYYKLSSTCALKDLDYVEVYGDGISSLLVIANGSGFNALTLDSTIHATIRGIGIYGTLGSGNGIELINASHFCVLRDIWVGWVSGDGIKCTQGISLNCINVHVDQNIGFRPATLVEELEDGAVQIAFHVPSDAGGLNNNCSFTDCHANAAGAATSVKIGTSGGALIESFNWKGGLIQGSGVYKEVFLHTKNSAIDLCHIEPPTGAQTNYVAVLDGCVNTWVKNGVVTGDTQIINGSVNSGLDHADGYGMDISADSDRCGWVNGRYGNSTVGPTGGVIKDRSPTSRLLNLENAGNVRIAAGRSARENATVYFESNMEHWVGSAATVPCGFSTFGSATITRTGTAANVRSGSYAVSVVNATDSGGGFQIDLQPVNTFVGRYITVEIWVKNVSTAGLARVTMLEGGTGASISYTSHEADRYERMLVTFKPDSAATSVTLRFTSLIGTVYFDSVKLFTEEFVPVREMTLDGTVTPSISYGGRPVPLLVTSGTPTITNFLDPHVGVPFTLRFAGATVISDNANIVLAGSGNFTGAAGNTMTLMYGSDGVFREISRAVT